MPLDSNLEHRLNCAIAQIPAANAAAKEKLPDCDVSVDATFNARYGDNPDEINAKIAEQSDDIRAHLKTKIGDTPPGIEKQGKRPILEKHEEDAILKRAEQLCEKRATTAVFDFALRLRPGDLLAVCRDGELLLDKLVKLARTKFGQPESPRLKDMFNVRGTYDPNLHDTIDDIAPEDPLSIIRNQLNDTVLSSPKLIDALYLEENYQLVETEFSIEEDKTLSIPGAKEEDVFVILLDRNYSERKYNSFRSQPLTFMPGLPHMELRREAGAFSRLGKTPLLVDSLLNKNDFVGGNYNPPPHGYSLVTSARGETFTSWSDGPSLKIFKVIKKEKQSS